MWPHKEDENAPKLNTSTLGISGANVTTPVPGQGTPITTDKVTIYNAGVENPAPTFEAEFEGIGAEDMARAFAHDALPGLESVDLKIIGHDDLYLLGEALATAASRIAYSQSDVVIFPLRGGRKLHHIMVGMLEDPPPFHEMLFSEAASKPNDAFFLGELRRVVAATNQQGASYRIAVMDVGDSGKGTEKMMDLMRRLHHAEYRRQTWLVVFHVFHQGGDSYRFLRLQQFASDLTMVVETYPTDTTMLDDWVAVVGLGKVRRQLPALRPGGEPIIIAFPETVELPAAVMVKTSAGFRVFASKQGPHVANRLVSDFGTAALAMSDRHERLPRLDRWQKRTERKGR